MLIYLTMIDDPVDKAKFEQLYYKYRLLMYHVAHTILHNSHDAEECLQEAFIKVTKNIKKIGEINCHETRNFLVIIIRSTCLDYLRKRRGEATVALEEIEGAHVSHFSSEELVENDEALAKLADCILSLPEQYANILFLKYDNGLSNREIGKLLDLSQDNVRHLVLRAKSALAKKLQMEEGNDNVF